ncbi:POU domain, class 6, transcription factor 1 isoform X2 [Latimeria chalumnae]|uniref:POU domain, class 6, transcription factor 1 isoform X2 n=1 Tax=Latimeria chalumnae TaxID=7897 RepID=UPI00313B1604
MNSDGKIDLCATLVIVMSGHETIRVLEVGVDAPVQTGEDGKALEAAAATGGVSDQPVETAGAAGDATLPSTENTCNESVVQTEATSLPQSSPAAVPTICALSQAPSQQQQSLPLTVTAAPQVLTHDNLAAVVTGVMTSAGAMAQPLLIPFSVASQVAGQQGLALLTIPTATVAALPGLTTASPAGGIFKFPIASLQAAPVLNTAIQQLQQQQPSTTHQAQPVLQPPLTVQSPPPAPPSAVMQTQAVIQSQPTVVSTQAQKAPEGHPQISLQTTGISFNPAIISAASLGSQTQLLGSVAATPLIANALSGLQGITNQIITNAQGQVIGTLPLVVNSAGLTTTSTAAALQASNLQLQAVTPQLLLNAQGQVIATLASSPIQPPAVRKQASPESPVKTAPQPIQPAPAVSQPSVVIATSTPATMSAPVPVPITCADTPTVSQLVSKPQTGVVDEDGINLEEIREFAKNFKIRRLSLGLTQTQVGQALTATEGPAYSQSAICRFEKLDITPKSAQKLKPVLEKWLNEAELRNQEGQQNLMEFVGGEPSKKRKRRTSFTPQAIEALNAYFEKNALPTGQEITEIAKELNYDREVVRVWFCNRRQTLKNTSKLNVFQIP